MPSLLIYGNGRIAKILFQYLKNNSNVAAFTVDHQVIGDTAIENLPVIPFETVQDQYPTAAHKMIIAVGYAEMNKIRETKYIEAKEKGYEFINYIHPSVELHENVVIGENNVVLEHATLQPYSRLGNSNFIWSNAVVGHGSTVADNCWITSGAVVAGDAVISSNCFLGINATIGHNVNLGYENFVGANALISKSTNEKEAFASREAEKMRLDSQRFLKFSGV